MGVQPLDSRVQARFFGYRGFLLFFTLPVVLTTSLSLHFFTLPVLSSQLQSSILFLQQAVVSFLYYLLYQRITLCRLFFYCRSSCISCTVSFINGSLYADSFSTAGRRVFLVLSLVSKLVQSLDPFLPLCPTSWSFYASFRSPRWLNGSPLSPKTILYIQLISSTSF